jgi:hypothetical protein
MIYSTILIVLMVAYVATAFTTPLARITTTKQSTSHMSMARRGGGLQRELDDDGSVGRSSSSSSSSPSSSWLNTNKSIKELPTEEGKVRNSHKWKTDMNKIKFFFQSLNPSRRN